MEVVTNNKSGKQKQNVIGSNKELIKELFKGSNGIALAHNSKGQIILNCGVYDKEQVLIHQNIPQQDLSKNQCQQEEFMQVQTYPL